MHSLLVLTTALLSSTPFTLCLSASDIPRDTPVSSLISTANSYLAKGNYHDALTYFDVAISHDPQNYLTFFKRGATHLSLGNRPQAIQDFDQALRIKPDFEEALLQRAKIRSKNADWDGAKKDYKAAGKAGGQEIADLEEAQGAVLLAREAEKKGDWEGCVSNAGLAILTASTAPSLRRLRAHCRFERGEVREGVSDLGHVLQISPGSIELHLQMSAMLFYSLADTERGLAQIRKCLHSDPDSKACSKMHRAERKVDKQLKTARQLMEKRQYNNAVKLLVKTGDEAGLIEEVKKEIHDLKEAGTVHKKAEDGLLAMLMEMACEAYTEMNNHKRAKPYCAEVLKTNPHSLPALLSTAHQALESEDYDKAISALNTAKEHHPSAASIGPLLNKAHNLLRRSKTKDYYKVLGVARDADERTIRRAHRDLTKKYHPDKVRQTGISKEEAEKKMASINEAWEVLGNPELKARFDQGDDPNSQEQHAQHPFYGSPFFHHQHAGGGGGGQQFMFRTGGGGGGGAQFKFPGGFQFPGGGGAGGNGFPFG